MQTRSASTKVRVQTHNLSLRTSDETGGNPQSRGTNAPGPRIVSTTHAYQRVDKHEMERRSLEVPILLASFQELYTVIQDNIRNELQEWTVHTIIQRDYTR